MVDGFGKHGLHEAQLIGDRRRARQEVGDISAAAPVLGEVGDLLQDGPFCLPAGHRAESTLAYDFIRHLAPVPALQQGLVVKQIHMGGSAILEQIDDPLGSGGKMGRIAWRGGEEPGVEQARQRGRAERAGAAAKELPAGYRSVVFLERIHAYCFVMVSSRFRSSEKRPVNAACSVASSPRSRGASPTDSSARAASGSSAYCRRSAWSLLRRTLRCSARGRRPGGRRSRCAPRPQARRPSRARP